MDELLKLMLKLSEVIQRQYELFEEFSQILILEKTVLTAHKILELEQILIQKEHVSQKLVGIEKNRSSLVSLILSLVGYQDRGKKDIGFDEFILILEPYILKVSETFQNKISSSLKEVFEEIKAFKDPYLQKLKMLTHEVKLNKAIIKKLSSHIQGSLALFSSALLKEQYNHQGRVGSTLSDAKSFLNIKA
jgi:hypothetical protein